MAQRKRASIATKREVLQFVTSIMRGETEEGSGASPPKPAERCRAAELLGKQYGLFDRKEEVQPKGDVAAEIRLELKRMHERLTGRGA